MLVPDDLLEDLAERERYARAEVDRLRAAIKDLTIQMETAGQLADRLHLTRATLLEISKPDQNPDQALARVPSRPPLPGAYQDILAVFTRTQAGLRAKDLCHALHLDERPRDVESMRTKLKRLVGRDLLTEPEPGLFIMNRPNQPKT